MANDFFDVDQAYARHIKSITSERDSMRKRVEELEGKAASWDRVIVGVFAALSANLEPSGFNEMVANVVVSRMHLNKLEEDARNTQPAPREGEEE